MILRTRRERQETAESEEEQRYMPGSLEEAVRVAQEDEAFARKISVSTKRSGSAIRKRRHVRSAGGVGGKQRQTDGEQESGESAASSSSHQRES